MVTGQDLTRLEDERLWDQMTRRAHALAKAGNLVPKDIRGNPDAALAAVLTLDSYGMPATPVTIKQLHFIDGTPEPSAQLQAGLLAASGYEVDWSETGSTRASARIRARGGRWSAPVTWTIEQARTAGLLDEWVEKKTQDGVWPDSGKPRYRTEKFVLDRPGVDEPDWVERERRAGNTKRNENWWRYPDDMLCAKVVRRLLKRHAAHLAMGLYDAAAEADMAPSIPDETKTSPPAADAPQHPHAGGDPSDDEDDDIADAELVVDEDPSPDVDRTTARPAGAGEEHHSDEGLVVDGDWVEKFAATLRSAGLTDDDRHAIVDHVSGGRTRSTKELRSSEVPAARTTFARIRNGELRLADIDGSRMVVLGDAP